HERLGVVDAHEDIVEADPRGSLRNVVAGKAVLFKNGSDLFDPVTSLRCSLKSYQRTQNPQRSNPTIHSPQVKPRIMYRTTADFVVLNSTKGRYPVSCTPKAQI